MDVRWCSGRRTPRLLPLVVAAVLALAARPALAQSLSVTVRNGDAAGNNYFLVNGSPRFLVFVSYFDAFDVPAGDFITDLQYLKARGVDGIRIMANWWTAPNDYTSGPLQYAQDTLFLPTGTMRPATRDLLGWYLDRAREQGMLVDLTLTAETVSSNEFSGGPDDLNFPEYRSAILELVGFLRDRGDHHVILDLQNEGSLNGPCNGALPPSGRTCRDGGAAPMLTYDVTEVANTIHALDPSRIVMLSTHSDYGADNARALASSKNLDVVAWHDPRGGNWFQNYPALLPSLRGTHAVYLQEPTPLREQTGLTADNFRTAVNGAKASGAAAWCFHTKASFHMNSSNLRAKLEGPETGFLDSFRGALDATPWGINPAGGGGGGGGRGGGGGGILGPNQALFPGQELASTDGRFHLLYQGDGNLVLYRFDGVPLWSSRTNGRSAGQAAMQGDGNFVVYDASGIAVWNSGTSGNPGAFLDVQSDGNTVVYRSDGIPLWATNTCCQ